MKRIILVAFALLFISTPLISRAESAAPQQHDGDCSAAEEGQGWVNDTVVEPSTGISNRICRPPAAAGQGGPVTNVQQKTPDGAEGGGCFKLFGGTFFRDCIWNPLLGALGSFFLSIGAAILRMVGYLFDLLIYYVIIDFKSTLDTLGATTAINYGWTIFRDFSNIAIIGIFTFIAISIILGLKEFGQKKLVANVLIVAVLLNFSLLFTKIIIDGSNFVAFQIYKQMAGGNVTSPNQFDIAAGFLTPMGITGIFDQKKLISDVTYSTGSGLQALAVGLFGGILLIAVAAVLLYGSFLIISRAILFIFLMITAALAFATYLVPSLAQGQYGWSSWWKALINNAVFAPLIMLFLAISLGIVNAAGQVSLDSAGQAATLGSVLSDPTTQLAAGRGWAIVLTYIIGIGLLFISFKVASEFANSISGFSLAAALPAYGFGALGRIGGFVGRQTVGRGAFMAGNALQKASQDQGRGLFSRQLYDFAAQRAKGVAKRDFNLGRTALGAGVAGTAGLKSDDIAGKGLKGFEGTAKKRAEKYVEAADRMKMSKDDQKKFLESARNAVLKSDPEFAQRHAEASAVQNAATATKSAAEASTKKLEEEILRAVKPLSDTASRLREAANANPSDDSAQQRAREAEDNLQRELASQRASRQAALDQEKQRITTATKTINQSKDVLTHIEGLADKEAVRRGLRPEKVKGESELAAEMAHKRFSNLLARAAGLSEQDNDYLAKLAKKGVGDHHEKKEAKKIADYLKEKGGGHDEHTAPAAHAPAATRAPAAHPPAAADHGGGDHGGDDHGGGHH